MRDHLSAATILLVDHERGIRTVLRTLLQRNGYQVLEADGGEAANKIAETHARIDLLLTEVMMPVISGPELVRHLNPRYPDLKVLYMSRRSLDDLLRAPHIFERAFGFIRKPFAPDTLVTWVRGILEPAPKEPAAPTASERECPTVTILLIEHQPANLIAQSLILRSMGYMVLEAGSPADAWHSWYEHQGPIDMVLMKANPDRQGTTEFITRLQLLSPPIRALFVSDASSTEFDDMPCEYTVLHKPFRPDALADTISGLIAGRKTRAVASLS